MFSVKSPCLNVFFSILVIHSVIEMDALNVVYIYPSLCMHFAYSRVTTINYILNLLILFDKNLTRRGTSYVIPLRLSL